MAKLRLSIYGKNTTTNNVDSLSLLCVSGTFFSSYGFKQGHVQRARVNQSTSRTLGGGSERVRHRA